DLLLHGYFHYVDLSLVFVFFFSSRRRHTRWPRDWSSDMCSSDLMLRARQRARLSCQQISFPGVAWGKFRVLSNHSRHCKIVHNRSEERRVGKECRSWWWREK